MAGESGRGVRPGSAAVESGPAGKPGRGVRPGSLTESGWEVWLGSLVGELINQHGVTVRIVRASSFVLSHKPI